MKRLKNKITIFSLSLLSLSSLTVLNSCTHDDDTTITDPRRITSDDIKSYADLFDVFWKTMDLQYNYFLEQKKQKGQDWDEIYHTYYPKFAALKTYGRPHEEDQQIDDDFIAASGYFEEIINPIIDRHFNVTIQFPATNSNIITSLNFRGGMLDGKQPNQYPFNSKQEYMEERVVPDAIIRNDIIAGNLISNPDIYYLTFQKFSLASTFEINLADKYLSPGQGNRFVLTEEILSNKASLKAIEDPTMRDAIKAITFDFLKAYNTFSETKEFKTFIAEVNRFKQTEVMRDELIQATKEVSTAYFALPQFDDVTLYGSLYNKATAPYMIDFINLMRSSIRYGHNFPLMTNALSQVLQRAEFYQKFLNPLHQGDIKKIIIDLRSNGGGAVLDARFFIDRFITKNTVFAYQRTREGNGRFNHTPWVAATTHPHTFGIPTNIPIAILTDKGSASMSEITTLMLKSQGSHVVSVGEYSAGATAGLGDTDDFNGGTRDNIAGGKLSFYMPLLAMKDADGIVIEGVGIKPDLYVTPPTEEELGLMLYPDFSDRVLNEAIKHLNAK